MKIKFIVAVGLACTLLYSQPSRANYEVEVPTVTIIEPEQENIQAKIAFNQGNFIDDACLTCISEDDLKYLSSIIYAEARGQCEAGQKAVGIIVINRVESEKFKDSIIEVIYEKGQFTPVENGAMNSALKKYEAGLIPTEIIDAATYALMGFTTVSYKDKEYNLEDYLYFSRYIPNAKIAIQDHQFK